MTTPDMEYRFRLLAEAKKIVDSNSSSIVLGDAYWKAIEETADKIEAFLKKSSGGSARTTLGLGTLNEKSKTPDLIEIESGLNDYIRIFVNGSLRLTASGKVSISGHVTNPRV